MNVLVTGGLGYIGSHLVVELQNLNNNVFVIDNLSNSKAITKEKIESITKKNLNFYKLDIRNHAELLKIFSNNHIDAVIHLAGLKSVSESVSKPIEYYDNNISGTISLLKAMDKSNVKNLVFSSSATVYGTPEYLPLDEKHPRSATNPYGSSKLKIEYILEDLYKSNNSWSIIMLRYFNPIGAHDSGLIGDNPNGIPNNLMPYISRVALNKLSSLNVFGNNYDTKDGTGVRDYIHINDLSSGHIAALDFIIKTENTIEAVNLGTGSGTSVLELIRAYEHENNLKIKFNYAKRRNGDIASCYADVKKASRILGWKSKYKISDMCQSTHKFEMINSGEN